MINEKDRLTLKLTIDRKAARVVLAVALLSVLTLTLSSETLKLTTTYPSPVGVYNYIITTGDAGSATQNTILARNAGNVGIGTSNPGAKLDVNGSANVSGTLGVGAFFLAAGAGQGKVLTSDGAGKGAWQAPSSPTGALFGYCASDGSASPIEPAYPSRGGAAGLAGMIGAAGCGCRAGYTLVLTGSVNQTGYYSCAKN